MPYEAEISRDNPTCFLFLIDQSGSMSDPFGGGQGSESKADGLAVAINACLHELILKCTKGDVYRYFEVGVIGYGAQTGPALGGALAGRPLVWVDELYANPLRFTTLTKKVSGGAGGLVDQTVSFPIWFEAVADNGTPMTAAFQQALAILQPWVRAHPDAFPPVVMNFTDGEPTDGDPTPIANSIQQLTTRDGNVLVLNLHISSNRAAAITFPDSEAALPDNQARVLFRMSSVLPEFMHGPAADYGYSLKPQSRGFVFNAQIEQIIGFLNIGTRANNLR